MPNFSDLEVVTAVEEMDGLKAVEAKVGTRWSKGRLEFPEMHLKLQSRQYKNDSRQLSGVFSLGWAKAGIAILRDPAQKGTVGTLYTGTLYTPKDFGL